MKFTQNQIKYLNKNKAIIKKGDFDSFFKDVPENDRSIFARFFYANGIDILDSMRIIPDKLFYGCDILVGATLGKGCIEIGENAFANCQNLKAVTMPDSVKRLGNSSFENCPNLQQIKLSNKIEVIPLRCFMGDSNLGEVILPESVETIKPSAFTGCDNLILRVENIQNLSFKSSEKEFFKQHIRKMKKQESLNRVSLKEAFDESFPQWLKDGLTSDAQAGKYLKNRLLNAGIDLNKAKFVSRSSLPQKRNDPILKDENLLPVFQLSIPDRRGGNRTYIYVKGIDDGRTIWNPRKGDYVEFNYWPIKDLVDNTTNWGYLDITDATVSDYKNLKQTRNNMKRDLMNIPGALRYKAENDTAYADYHDTSSFGINGGWGKSNFDKSGYRIIKPEVKYKKALQKLKQSKAGNILDKVYSNLKYIQKLGKNAISDIDFMSDSSSQDESSVIINILNQLKDRIKEYNNILEAIRYWDTHPEDNFARVPSGYMSKDDVFDPNRGKLQRLINNTDSLKKQLDKYEDSFIDWEVEESLKKNNAFTINEKLFEDIENLEDVDMITNPVMQDAKEQSDETSKIIEKEMKDIEKEFPSDEQKVIGAEKQEVPKTPEEPKITLDESLFNEEKGILYVIKDSQGNQLSRPNPDDDELWDRVESMEARGRRGLRVVVYTGK